MGYHGDDDLADPADDADEVDTRLLCPSSSVGSGASVSVRGVSGIDDRPDAADDDEWIVESEGSDDSVELSHRACMSPLLSGLGDRENDGGDIDPSLFMFMPVDSPSPSPARAVDVCGHWAEFARRVSILRHERRSGSGVQRSRSGRMLSVGLCIWAPGFYRVRRGRERCDRLNPGLWDKTFSLALVALPEYSKQ